MKKIARVESEMHKADGRDENPKRVVFLNGSFGSRKKGSCARGDTLRSRRKGLDERDSGANDVRGWHRRREKSAGVQLRYGGKALEGRSLREVVVGPQGNTTGDEASSRP